MRTFALVVAGLAVAGLVVMAGCHHEKTKVVVVHQEAPETVVVQQQAPPPAVVVAQPEPEPIVVAQPPPPVIIETAPPPPAVGVIWIGGYYTYHDHRYFLVRGHYERPPHGGARWEAPRYDRGRYHPGHWR